MIATARSIWVKLLPVAFLICSFVAIALWFDDFDFYHRRFFDAGTAVIAYNLVRILFVGIFSWLIYAPGAGFAALIISPRERDTLSPAERAVIGFGIGVGVWHIVLLILGILNLYYRPMTAGLCLLILVGSANHFSRVAIDGWRMLTNCSADRKRRHAELRIVGVILIVVAAAWLLLLRGLYPGGGGDYYTHYFPYYLAVLDNHGLTPNDVWYHYFYSKGSGLAFLGMLLTDPEAPALATFPYVVFAAVAIWALAKRMVSRSPWPIAAALVYLLFYLGATGRDEGQFQKDHEVIAALIVLTMWALCMRHGGRSRLFVAMAAATGTAAAIVTQPAGILLGSFIGILCLWSLLCRRWSEGWDFGLVATAITSTVLLIFLLNYLVTGLVSDQALTLMLGFADFSRLDRWGVIPQLIAIVWLRDNYWALKPSFSLRTFLELYGFMRLSLTWPSLLGPFIAVAIFRRNRASAAGSFDHPVDSQATSFALATAALFGALVGYSAIIALLVGPTQPVSFYRFSTFFVPLLALFGVAGSVWVLNGRSRVAMTGYCARLCRLCFLSAFCRYIL
jgi:hypothetical protein